MTTLRRETATALLDLGFKPRKRLGQSFLVDRGVAARIVDAAVVDGRSVLEIGPGLGALTDVLAERAERLVLLEVDLALADRLRARFAGRPNVHVIQGDALRVDFAELPLVPHSVVVSNLPYAAGSRILLRLVEQRRCFSELVLMLQTEVAERLVATPGNREYGLLTVFAALYGEPRILFRVPPRAFVPRPKVESSVVSIRLQDEPRIAVRDVERFRAIVRASFGQRRKTLRNALAALVPEVEIAGADIDPRRRGETLALAEFARLADRV
ncbi:MAG: rRNA (adenine1518-N6/adenine1519-N6)-dimethyltransferase [Candidatus Binatota bacterium]|nr:rRNA (adenine1518-N6/adenine1519-N6)-dimethyltransferase [Candidatus Binatota bacterium]